MSKTQPEKVIENRILCFLEDIGFWARKLNSVGVFDPTKKVFRKNNSRFNQRGMPDIIALRDGQWFLIEVKTPRGKLNPHQQQTIREIQSHQGIVFVTRSVGQTFETLKPFIKMWQNFEHVAEKYIKLENASQDH